MRRIMNILCSVSHLAYTIGDSMAPSWIGNDELLKFVPCNPSQQNLLLITSKISYHS